MKALPSDVASIAYLPADPQDKTDGHHHRLRHTHRRASAAAAVYAREHAHVNLHAHKRLSCRSLEEREWAALVHDLVGLVRQRFVCVCRLIYSHDVCV